MCNFAQNLWLNIHALNHAKNMTQILYSCVISCKRKWFISNECAISCKTYFVLIRKWYKISHKKNISCKNAKLLRKRICSFVETLFLSEPPCKDQFIQSGTINTFNCRFFKFNQTKKFSRVFFLSDIGLGKVPLTKRRFSKIHRRVH